MIFCLFWFGLTCQLFAQGKTMNESVYDDWKRVEDSKISNNGDWIVYTIKPHKGDKQIHFYHTRSDKTYTFDRGESPALDQDNGFAVFNIKPHADTIYQLKKRKVDKKKHPKDTLGVFYFDEKKLIKIPDVSEYQIPTEWGGVFAYKKEPITKEKDSLAHSALAKEENETNGSRYILRITEGDIDLALPFCKKVVFSNKKNQLLYESTGTDSVNATTVYFRDLTEKRPHVVSETEGTYNHFVFSEKGNYVSYTANFDTTEARISPMEVFMYDCRQKNNRLVANNDAPFLNDGWIINEHKKPHFSENEQKLFFYTNPKPILQDTSLLDEEIVNVEVWTTEDRLLYTQQENRLDTEKKRGYMACYNIGTGKINQLAGKQYDEIRLSKKGDHTMAMGIDVKPYQKQITWEGYIPRNLSIINTETSEKKEVIKSIHGFPSWSPEGNYILWYDRKAKAYKIYDLAKEKDIEISNNKISTFYNELHDTPSDPWNYGIMEWTAGDASVFVYDRYDIWELFPNARKKPRKITNGREQKTRYRWINLDEDLDFLPADTSILVSLFKEGDKSGGYAKLNLATSEITPITQGPYRYASTVTKARDSEDLFYTKENFETFPDLIYGDMSFSDPKTISDINPQQKDYGWGSIELVSWQTENGRTIEGMLVKPANFKEGKKYPMIVNFYEKSSQGLHRHREPFAHRSTINYSYYANKGYVIFNPDIAYTTGEPGESCLEAVMSGVDYVLSLGFVDEQKMGLQGHSWGGYQIAYLLNKTQRFKCAESGAPVVNMTSAYGGIRWGSGMSRMFQYEKTQSRLGATLWNNPDVYLKNSPLFDMDKMNTPVLILHNDKDGAVPWYQGIEYYMALRRLGKQAWFLNYNDEPHWPLKRQNRLDFNKRMEQFFGYYLKGEPMPRWMLKGVPAIEKGIDQGLDYLKK